MIKESHANHPLLEDHFTLPGNRPSSLFSIIPADHYPTVLLFSGRANIVAPDRPGPKPSTILISTMKTKGPPSRSGAVLAQMSERVLTFRNKGLCVGCIQCPLLYKWFLIL